MESKNDIRLLNELGWHAESTIEEGLLKVIEFEKKFMKYLVTGGCGFIGSNLAAEVLKRGEDLVVFDNLFVLEVTQI